MNLLLVAKVSVAANVSFVWVFCSLVFHPGQTLPVPFRTRFCFISFKGLLIWLPGEDLSNTAAGFTSTFWITFTATVDNYHTGK